MGKRLPVGRSTRLRDLRRLFSLHQDQTGAILQVVPDLQPIPGLDFLCLPVCIGRPKTSRALCLFAHRLAAPPIHSPQEPTRSLHHKRQGLAAPIYHSMKFFLAWCGLLKKEHAFVNTKGQKNMLPGSCKMRRIALEAARDTNSSLYVGEHGILERG